MDEMEVSLTQEPTLMDVAPGANQEETTKATNGYFNVCHFVWVAFAASWLDVEHC